MSDRVQMLIDRGPSIARRFGIRTMPANPALQDLPRLAGQVGPYLLPGRVILITGASGSGKSSLLAQLERQLDHRAIPVHSIPLPEGIVVDCFPQIQTEAVLESLGRFGLGEVYTDLSPARKLSTGQQFRLRLAMAWGADDDLPYAAGAALRRIRHPTRPGQCGGDAHSYAAGRSPRTAGSVSWPAPATMPSPHAQAGPDRSLRLRALQPFAGASRMNSIIGAIDLPFPGKLAFRIGRASDYRRLARFHYTASAPASFSLTAAIDYLPNPFVVRTDRGRGPLQPCPELPYPPAGTALRIGPGGVAVGVPEPPSPHDQPGDRPSAVPRDRAGEPAGAAAPGPVADPLYRGDLPAGQPSPAVCQGGHALPLPRHAQLACVLPRGPLGNNQHRTVSGRRSSNSMKRRWLQWCGFLVRLTTA